MLLKNNIDEIKSLVRNNSVLTSKEECYCYSADASNFPENITQPDLVVFAQSIEDVRNVLKYANLHKIPVTARGAGTNMVGGCLCLNGGIVLNFSKMNKIIEINPTNMTAKVQPGVILGDLKDEAEKVGLFFPPDPSNYRVSTVGGAIAQSSGGALSFKYGTTKDYLLSLKVVTASGELLELGSETTKNSVGYHLGQLMVGSEGTLGIIVEATFKLIPKPECSNVIVAYFNNPDDAVSAVNNIIVNNVFPAAIEYMDNNAITTVESFIPSKFKTVYDCVILIELDGDRDSVKFNTKKTLSILKTSDVAKVYVPLTEDDYERVWRARRSSFAASARLAPDVISDDIIVPRSNLSRVVKVCNNVSKKYNLKMCLVGHIGDGNLHPQMVFDAGDEKQFKNYLDAKAEIYQAVAELGGTISAEHGIGIEKRPYLKSFLDKNVIEYMRSIKRIFDPNNILNPNKIFVTDKE